MGKPLIHSAGAGLSLAAAGTTVLLGASAMVAFNGWPGMREDVPTAPVRLAAAPPPLRGAEGGVAQRPAAIRLRAVPARRGRVRVATRSSAVAPARGAVLGISKDAPARKRKRSSSVAAETPVVASAPGDGSRSKTPAEQLQQTVDEAVGAVPPVLDPVRTVVGGTGEVVDTVVKGLGDR